MEGGGQQIFAQAVRGRHVSLIHYLLLLADYNNTVWRVSGCL